MLSEQGNYGVSDLATLNRVNGIPWRYTRTIEEAVPGAMELTGDRRRIHSLAREMDANDA